MVDGYSEDIVLYPCKFCNTLRTNNRLIDGLCFDCEIGKEAHLENVEKDLESLSNSDEVLKKYGDKK